MAWLEDIDDVRRLRTGMANIIALASTWIFFALSRVAHNPHAPIDVGMVRVRLEVRLLVLVGLFRVLVVIHAHNERVFRGTACGV